MRQRGMHGFRGRIACLLSLAAALVLTLGIGGRDLARAEAEWNQVVLIYQSDCKGKIDPCG